MSTLLKLDIIIILVVLLAMAFTKAEANEGFYFMMGLGENNSSWNDEFGWRDNGELGCGFGLGWNHDINENWTIDVSAKHKSQCLSGPPMNSDNESGAEFYYVDFYYFPGWFK